MTRTIAALLAAASIAGVCAPAAAQTKYFARERIVGLAKTAAVTYVPTYSSTFGSCVDGSQSKAMTSCTTSDNKPANLSDCSSFPQTTEAKTCMTGSCESLISGGASSGGGKLEYVGNTKSLQTANEICQTAVKTRTSGVCGWLNSANQSGIVYPYDVYYVPGASLQFGNGPTFYGAKCTAQ